VLSLQTLNETFQVQSDLLQYQIELQTKLLVARGVIELSHERQGEVIDRQMRMEPNQPAVTTEVPGGTRVLGNHLIQDLVLQQDPEFLQRALIGRSRLPHEIVSSL
jgi:hypothetical protein